MSPALREHVLRWLLAVGATAVLLFFFSPNWGAFLLGARVPEMQGLIELRRGAVVAFQIEHPGAAIPDALHGAIQWRLLFPGIAHLLGLPLGALTALAYCGCVAVLGYAVAVLRRGGATWRASGLGALVVGAASWFFASTGWLGYFDSWVVLALLVVAFSGARWAVWTACLLAPWIDERFVLGAPLALWCAHLRAVSPKSGDAGAPGATQGAAGRWIDWAVPAGLLAAFVAVRLAVLGGKSAGFADAGKYLEWLDLSGAPASRFLLGAWEGLRGGWIFVGLAVAGAWPRRGAALGLAAGTLAVAGVALATAQDFSRAMLFVAPVVLLGLETAVRRAGRTTALALPAAALATVLLPAHLVMSDQVKPVLYLYHELAALRQPPPIAMPELYELRAIEALQAGNVPFAEQQLTLAIKLAPGRPGPLKQRGVLYASNGRWPDARGDFAAMTTIAPQDPEGWFFLAQAELVAGRTVEARKNFEQALACAPQGWTQRPDVTRFAARLQQAK